MAKLTVPSKKPIRFHTVASMCGVACLTLAGPMNLFSARPGWMMVFSGLCLVGFSGISYDVTSQR